MSFAVWEAPSVVGVLCWDSFTPAPLPEGEGFLVRSWRALPAKTSRENGAFFCMRGFGMEHRDEGGRDGVVNDVSLLSQWKIRMGDQHLRRGSYWQGCPRYCWHSLSDNVRPVRRAASFSMSSRLPNTDHKRVVPSRLAVTRRVPSGLKSADQT